VFQCKNASTLDGKVESNVKIVIVNECNECKQDHKKANVLGTRTKEEQNYCEVGKKKEVKEKNGGHHIVIHKVQTTCDGTQCNLICQTLHLL
jgi:hypothetical protein